MKIEIRYRENYDDYELWQHILNKPKDILFQINYSNLIWSDKNKDFITRMAMNKFNIPHYRINYS